MATWCLLAPSRRSGRRAAKGSARPPGGPGGQDVCPRPATQESAGEAGTCTGPRISKDLCPPGTSRPVAGTTARRRLATPGRTPSRHRHPPRRARQRPTSSPGQLRDRKGHTRRDHPNVSVEVLIAAGATTVRPPRMRDRRVLSAYQAAGPPGRDLMRGLLPLPPRADHDHRADRDHLKCNCPEGSEHLPDHGGGRTAKIAKTKIAQDQIAEVTTVGGDRQARSKAALLESRAALLGGIGTLRSGPPGYTRARPPDMRGNESKAAATAPSQHPCHNAHENPSRVAPESQRA